MARCKNDRLIDKIGIEKLDKTVEVEMSILADIDSCVKTNTKNYLSIDGNTSSYNPYTVPADMFSCLPEGCKNSGTLTVTNGAGLATGGTFAVKADATEFVAGVVTYYIHFPAAGTYTVATTISDITDISQTNADVYTQDITVTGEGFFPVAIDLSQAPSSLNGTGWVATESGILINIDVLAEDELLVPVIGLSSIYIYNSIEDFEVNDTVKIGCLDEFAGDDTIDPTDATCFGAGYDPNSVTIERTVTGKKVTANYWKLNPLVQKSDQTIGWFPQTVEKTVVATTVNGVDYGYVQLPDMFLGECSFLLATIADNCNITDSMLNRLNTPVPLAVNEKQYIVLNGSTTTETDAGKILFHESLIGKNVVVNYPKEFEIDHYVANDNDLNSRKVRMAVPRMQTDGVKVLHIYNNVLVTSFPHTINTEETVFSFTLSIQRDRNNNFFEIARIKE